jgi:hypothetical protein
VRSISPVIQGHRENEVVLAKDQPEYAQLPALPIEGGMMLTRWRFTWRERLQILFFCDLHLWVWTFGKPFQPVALQIVERVREYREQP